MQTEDRESIRLVIASLESALANHQRSVAERTYTNPGYRWRIDDERTTERIEHALEIAKRMTCNPLD